MSAGTETAAVANGNSGAPSDEHLFPLDTFKDAAKHLRRPFTVHAVKFKVQATWDGNGAGGLIVSYIDARLAIERLNLICPHLWHDRYEAVSANRMWCHLTVDGITRSDVGDGEGKGLVSDALKRAAVHFGVGVSLYAIPQIKLFLSDGHLRDTGRKDTRGKPIFELTPNGLGRCRQLYEAWLENAGKAAFGEPLDHGDVEEAVGDAEEAPATPGPPAEPVPQTAIEAESRDSHAPRFIDAERVETIANGFRVLGLKIREIDELLAAAGLSALRARSPKAVMERLAELTPEEADKLEVELEREAEKAS